MSDISDANIEATKESAIFGQIKSFIAGGVGGVCSVLTGHPFDLVKVRQQTNSGLSAVGACGQIMRHDGPFGFYRGVTAPLIGVTPIFAVSFWGYDVGQRIVKAVSPVSESGKLSILQTSVAGFISAIPMTLITAPFERVKVLLQIQGQGKLKPGEKQFTGVFDVVRHLYKEGGVRSVFRGSAATLARDGPGSALYFAAYEAVKRRVQDEQGGISLGWIMIAGASAGVAMWVPVFPIDTIKSNLQSSNEPTSIGRVTRQIYARGGFKAFFPGVGAALARSLPANAATFLGVELTHQAFQRLSR